MRFDFMSQETRGSDDARKVKVFSALAMVGGVIVAPIGAAIGGAFGELLTLVGLVGLAGGFIGFVIGRFMD